MKGKFVDSEIYQEIKKRVKLAESDRSKTSKGVVDGLLILAEAIPNELPKQFKKILVDLDQRFYAAAMDAKKEIGRLGAILDAHSIVSNHTAPLRDPLELLPVFELNDTNKERVLELCSEMRKIVLGTVEFDQPHKVRLSNRIAAMEAEVNKEKGLFDVILGGVSDVGETLKKFGTDIKPLTDRMGEVLKITRDSTREYDKLPMPDEIKRLPAPDDTDGE